MHTKTKTLAPAPANRALIARWRRYRLNGPDAILPLARCPHHVLAAEVLRKVGFTNNAERLTESGVLAVLGDWQPLVEFVLIEREIVGYNVLAFPRAFLPMLGVPVDRIATEWWYVQEARKGRPVGQLKDRWRGYARAFLGHPEVRDESLRVLHQLPDVPMRRAVPDPAQSSGAGCFFHFPAP